LTFEGAGDLQANNPGGRKSISAAGACDGRYCERLSYRNPVVRSNILIFSDYARPAIRLGAIMELPFSILHARCDGRWRRRPTHSPSNIWRRCGAMPGLITLRPQMRTMSLKRTVTLCSFAFTAVLALSRQPLPLSTGAGIAPAAGVAKSAYVLATRRGDPQVIIIVREAK